MRAPKLSTSKAEPRRGPWINRVLVATALTLAAVMLATGPGTGGALAAEEARLVIHNHQFMPAELEVPAGVKIKLMVENRDSEPEEFESYDLSREKMVPAGTTVPILIGPLKPGHYKFFGEFHQDTAQGVIVVKEPETK